MNRRIASGLSRREALVAAGLGGFMLAGCSAPDDSSTGGDGAKKSQVVLADVEPVGEYNPIVGYAATGVSPLYEGLLRPSAPNDKEMPKLVPALAESEPSVSADGKTWTVKLRKGVKFHDGSAFEAKDVAATYRAIVNPKAASPIADDYLLIDKVETPDAHTVVFKLKTPNSGFASRLLLAIAPASMIETENAEQAKLNTKPVGTGPFKLVKLSSNEAVMEANPDYRLGKPEVAKLIIRHVPDDNARLQQVLTGQVDGANLPPRLAESVKGKDKLTLVNVHTSDWRGVSLPMAHAFTADTNVRRALNIALDAPALVNKVLAGHGEPTTNPISKQYPEHVSTPFSTETDPAKRRAEAEEILDDAGWKKGADGVRAKGSDKAEITLAYSASDTLRRELSSAFADQMRLIGVKVKLWGATWDDIEPKISDVAVMLGGGDNPYTVDTQAYRSLHSRTKASGPFDNPGRYSNAKVDAALDAARASRTEEDAAPHYKKAQEEYLKDPGYVFLATLQHTYIERPTGFSGPAPVSEPHTHGSTWGPWWSIGEWKRK